MLQWHDPETGRRKSRAAGTANPNEAEQKARDLEYELNNGLHAEPSQMSWEQFHDLYANEKLSGLRASTRSKAGTIFDTFGRSGSGLFPLHGRVGQPLG